MEQLFKNNALLRCSSYVGFFQLQTPLVPENRLWITKAEDQGELWEMSVLFRHAMAGVWQCACPSNTIGNLLVINGSSTSVTMLYICFFRYL